MVKRSTRRIFPAARLFMAWATFVLLTITTMQRQDYDGYQATHLFFTPRQSWEMDQGRGMLYEEERYREMDLQALVAETTGGEADLSSQAWEGSYRAAGPNGSNEESAAPHSQSPALRRMPYSPGQAGHEIPLAFSLAAILPAASLFFAGGGGAIRAGTWQGETPTPPPQGTIPL